jgi:ribonuclease HI
VLRAVRLGRELGATRLELLLDSNLIVEQLHVLRGLPGGWTAAHVRREQNTIADKLANEAIDRVMGGGPAVVVRRPG